MTQRTGTLRVQVPDPKPAAVFPSKVDCSDRTIEEVLGFLNASAVAHAELRRTGLTGPAEVEREAFIDHLRCAFRVKAALLATSQKGRVVTHFSEKDQGRTIHQGLTVQSGGLPFETCQRISAEILRLFKEYPSVFPSAVEMKLMQELVGKEVSGQF